MSQFGEFFEATVAAAKIQAKTAVNDVTDPLSLEAGMSHEAAMRFIALMKPIAATPEFLVYLEHVLIRGYQYLFTVIDGIADISPDNNAVLTDCNGNESREPLYLEFEQYLHDSGHIKPS